MISRRPSLEDVLSAAQQLPVLDEEQYVKGWFKVIVCEGHMNYDDSSDVREAEETVIPFYPYKETTVCNGTAVDSYWWAYTGEIEVDGAVIRFSTNGWIKYYSGWLKNDKAAKGRNFQRPHANEVKFNGCRAGKVSEAALKEQMFKEQITEAVSKMEATFGGAVSSAEALKESARLMAEMRIRLSRKMERKRGVKF